MEYIYRLPALLAAIILHEYAHGFVAGKLGDPTARNAGRLTLNPLAHLDPIGLVMLWAFGFGWAKPVPINPFYFEDRRRGLLYVSLAGPATNLTVAFLSLLVLRLDVIPWGSWLWQVMRLVVMYNLWLGVFNLIPVPPLDGSKIFASLIPSAAGAIYRLEQYGFLILIVGVYFGLIGAVLIPLSNGIFAVMNWVLDFIL